MNDEDKPTVEERKLLNEVDSSSDFTLEGYIEGYKQIRLLGNALLKVYSKIESQLDDIIICWAEKLSGTHNLRTLSSRINYFQKYYPLLSKMYFIDKIKVLMEYSLLKENNTLFCARSVLDNMFFISDGTVSTDFL